MTKYELLRRLADHEDSFTERKSDGVKDSQLRSTLCGFANSTPAGREAILFIGISDKDGTVVGVQNTDALQKRVRQCAEECYPTVECTSEALIVDGKSIVMVIVPTSKKRPHFAGTAYVRIGSETVKAPEEVFKRLLYEHHDKCREIQRHLGKTITVFDIKPMIIGQYPWTVTLLDCTPHIVRYRIKASEIEVSKSLEEVIITEDNKTQRFALRVKTS